jgi:peptidyl-prolyl cis-trans isomerase A (cyclophilin A)
LNFSLTRRALAALALGASIGASSWAADAPRVKLATTAGDIVIEVYPDKTPKTAENFLQYVRDKHYDGTIFHRVIDRFMIQGGGMDAKMNEKPTRPPVALEAGDALAKGLRNQVGTVAMARTSDPDSATSQFFINVADNSGRLDPRGANAGYTVFGKVVSGMDVVNKIKGVPTGNSGPHGDVPVTPVVITSATIVK